MGRFGFDTDNYNYIRRFKCPELWSADRYRKDDGSINFTRQKKEQVMDQTSGNSGERKEYFEAELQYARNFKGHMLNGTLKYSQDSKVRTQEIGKEIVNSLPFRHQGLAGRIAYNWNYRYFLNFNFGYTGSENFASGHQFGFFPAYSTAWNIAEEPFVKKNLKWMNMFKVRYSWGKVGNDKMYEPNGVQIRFPYLYAQQGLTVEQYFQFTGLSEEKMMEEMEPQAEKRIRTRLVLEAIVKAENIEVTDERLDEELQKMADAYQMEVEKLKEFMGENEKAQMKEDIAVQDAVTLITEAAVEA